MRHLCLIMMLMLSGSVAAADAQDARLPAWMSGNWTNHVGEKWAEEVWLSPRGNMMLGNSWSGEGDSVGFWEQMRIERETKGDVVFWAVAGDQKPVRFVASEIGKQAITFENPQHDYPQRIRYWRVGKKLKAEISLMDGGRSVQFAFDTLDEK
jgi:Domain of unknown function (DUF6265)